MQYKHLKLLDQMLEQNVDHKKILHYFQLEGYGEEEVLEEITAYEREKALKKTPSAPPAPS